ncbi:MAG: hypothetical protein DCF18_13075 [Cyanobium sp.]|nr:MAG: hypothetical protein DCF18_13075 [Cyanobium sp.]
MRALSTFAALPAALHRATRTRASGVSARSGSTEERALLQDTEASKPAVTSAAYQPDAAIYGCL